MQGPSQILKHLTGTAPLCPLPIIRNQSQPCSQHCHSRTWVPWIQMEMEQREFVQLWSKEAEKPSSWRWLHRYADVHATDSPVSCWPLPQIHTLHLKMAWDLFCPAQFIFKQGSLFSSNNSRLLIFFLSIGVRVWRVVEISVYFYISPNRIDCSYSALIWGIKLKTKYEVLAFQAALVTDNLCHDVEHT